MSGPNDARRPIADTPADDEQRARLRKLIDKARVAMFTTLDPSQQTMHSRPLQTVGCVLNVNDRPGNALLGPTTIALSGRSWQTDVQGGLRFRVSFGSFYQLHRHADAILFQPALAMLGDVAGLRVVDGYGGVGTFALRLLRLVLPRGC